MLEECLNILREWLVEQKNRIYSENIKLENDANELQVYRSSLEEFARDLIRAIEEESSDTLISLGWPEKLMECIKTISIRVDILHDIESSFIRFPFNKSEIHRNELEKEKAGLQ
jgi:hypothetical protein